MKAKDLASALGLQLRGDGDTELDGIAPIEQAGVGMLSLLAHPKYLRVLQKTRPACVIAPGELAGRIEIAALVSEDPYLDFAKALELFSPPYRPANGIDASARISSKAEIGHGASIGAYCVIGPGARIGRNAIIHPHATIYPGVQIGADFVCHSQVSIREKVIIGNSVVIHNGAVIGSDGFRFMERNGGLLKIPHTGTVVIEDDVEIGANVTIDRAISGATRIRRGAKLDNLIQIGHNCDIGEYSRFAAQVGIAGSVQIGEWCEFGGQAGCADHITIGKRVRVSAQAGIPNSLEDGAVVYGTPALDVHTFRRMVAVAPKLPQMVRRLKALEDKIAELTEKLSRSNGR